MASQRIDRREYLKYIGAFVAGLVIAGGGVAAYYAAMPVKEKVVKETVTKTITKTVTVTPGAPPTAVKKFKWGTSKVGSSGYRALIEITRILSKEMPDYDFSAYPTPGAVASMKGYAKGELDGCYGADVGFNEMYRFEKRFKDFKPQAKRMPVQTFWSYTIEVTLAIHDSKIGVYKKWADLNGKKIFTFPLGWDVHAVLVPCLDTLGVKYEHVELDLGMVGSALEKGEIDATGVYTTSRRSPAPWIKELEMTTDIAILNPSEDEIKKLKAAGFEIVEVDPKKAYATDVNVDKIYARAFYYGFHVGTEISEDDVYRMLKILEKHKEDLVAYDPGFEVLARDFAGFQARGVAALYALNPDVPVHPGLAKYLKEHGLWRDEWKIAG